MLLQYDYRNKQWALPCSKYTLQDGSEKVDVYNVDSEGEKSVVDMCDMHSMIVVEKQNLTYTAEQEERLKEVKSMPDGWSTIYNAYVMEGVFLDIDTLPYDHPMHILEAKVMYRHQDEVTLALAMEIANNKKGGV